MIARTWYAKTTPEKEKSCIDFVTAQVFPELRAIAGYKDAYVLRRVLDQEVELLVITIWESMEAVRKFAGDNPDRAVVPPAAHDLLTEWDPTTGHYEIVVGPR